MKSSTVFLVLILFSVFSSAGEPKSSAPQTVEEREALNCLEADVCVIGGGSGGCGAAIAAAREGADVVLVERWPLLGGTGTNGMVSNWEGGPGCEIAKEIYERMHARGMAGIAPSSDPGIPKEKRIPMGFRMASEEPYELSLTRAIPPMGGYRSVVFLPEAFDRVVREMLEETGNAQILSGTEFFEPELSEDGTRIQSVLVRKTEDPACVTRIRAKVFIDSTGSAVLCRRVGCEAFLGEDPQSRFQEETAPQTVEKLRLNALTLCYRIDPKKEKNSKEEMTETPTEAKPVSFPKCAYVTGWLDGPRMVNMMPTLPGEALFELGEAECQRRAEAIVRAHWAFLRTLEPFRNYELTAIAPMLGIRESWRIRTRYVLREADVMGGWDAQNHPDRIAVADHPCDVHGAGGGLRNLQTAYGIPYRCLIPDSPIANLLVACRGAGFSRIAASSCRLQRTMIQLGHAAGTAAAWAARQNCGVEAIDVPKLVEKMNAHSRYPFPKPAQP